MSDRVVRSTVATIAVELSNGSVAVDSTTTVTIEVRRGTTVVVLPGTATVKPPATTGRYEFTLTPAHTATLGALTAYWSVTIGGQAMVLTTTVEVVGGVYFTLAAMREELNLANPATYSDTKLADARAWFEDRFEDLTGVAWVPRLATETFDGTYQRTLILGHLYPVAITAVSVLPTTGTATSWTSGELADLRLSDTGEVYRRSLGHWPSTGNVITVTYEHGHAAPPSDIVQAGLIAVRERLTVNRSGPRPYLVQTEGVIERFGTAGPERPFGIPDVDDVVRRRATGLGSYNRVTVA